MTISTTSTAGVYKPKKSPGKMVTTIISKTLLVIVGVLFFSPFLWMIFSSLKPSNEVLSSGGSLLGSRLAWENYSVAFSAVPFARILLNRPRYVMLDEATSALDSESEEMVRRALEQLMRGRTTVMIAHRFSSIAFAHRLLFFEAGRVTGDGSPAVLRETHPAYRRLCELQQLR